MTLSGEDRNLVLVGFMGTGKTTVGRILAARLDRPLLDMDEMIEQRADKPITAIFAEDGEPAFRAMERGLVRELTRRGGQLISAGGGAVLDGDNMRDFSASGLVVCLQAEPGEILRRVQAEEHRPLLSGDKRRQIETRLRERAPFYDAVPFRIDTTNRSPEEVAGRILERYRDEPRGANA